MTDSRPKFVHPRSTPPIGWVYEVDHEGVLYTFQSPMRLGLMQQLRQWYADKKLEWPGDREMTARVEAFVCERVPGNFCKGGSRTQKVPFLSTSSIRDVTRLFLSRLFKGKDIFVPDEEAARRAKICANCPKNLHGICTSCMGNEFQDIFRWLLARGRSTAYDSVLDTCSVCGCLLKAKVHVTTKELSNLEPHTYPKNCWLYNTACHREASEMNHVS